MDAFPHNIKIPIDAARWTKDLHEIVREKVEEMLGVWRVTKIEQESTTAYDPTLLTLQSEHPEYILSKVTSAFIIEAIEDGPLEQRIDIYRDETRPVRRSKLQCKLYLMSDGLLMWDRTELKG